MQVEYDPRFANLLPESAFPLPCPKFPMTLPGYFDRMLDEYAAYVTGGPEVSKRCARARPNNPILRDFADILWSTTYFYSGAMQTPRPEDWPNRDLAIVQYRARVLEYVDIGRRRDWAAHVVREYAGALHRGRSVCFAAENGRLPETGEVVTFKAATVKNFANTGKSVSGVVSYARVRRALLTEATP